MQRSSDIEATDPQEPRAVDGWKDCRMDGCMDGGLDV